MGQHDRDPRPRAHARPVRADGALDVEEVATWVAHDPVQDRYLMEHVRGLILRVDLPRGVALDEEQCPGRAGGA